MAQQTSQAKTGLCAKQKANNKQLYFVNNTVMIDIINGLHFTGSTRLAIKTRREQRVTAIHNIKIIYNILWY